MQLTDGSEQVLPRLGQTGQWTRPVQVRATGRTGVVIVSFYPWGAYPFLGFPLCEIADTHLEMEAAFRDAPELSPCARVRQIQRYLCARLREDRHDALVELAARRIDLSRGRISIERLARSLHLSERQLGRRFRRVVGVAPKTFCRITRFQKALGARRAGAGWNRIVDLCGYSDQSHFIREIKAFSGFSPEKLPAGRPESPLSRRFNAHADSSDFFNTVYL